MPKRQLKKYDNIVLEIEDFSGSLNFVGVFGRKNALHVEIGSGRGTFLAGQAVTSPGVDFLGIEWARKYYRYAVDRIGRHKVENVRLIRTEAATFIAKNIADKVVDCFHIYFPDPWPKRAHHKRRFVSKENVAQMIRCLQKDGIINIATDHKEYHEWMKDIFENFAECLKPINFVKPAGAREDEFVGTNYERKYIKEKRNIFTLAFKKL